MFLIMKKLTIVFKTKNKHSSIFFVFQYHFLKQKSNDQKVHVPSYQWFWHPAFKITINLETGNCSTPTADSLLGNFSAIISPLNQSKTGGELTHSGRDGASSLRAIQTCSSGLLLRSPGLDTPGGAVLSFWRLFFTVVIFHVVMQQLCFTEWLCAAWSATLKWVVVKINRKDWRRLVLDNSVH